MKEKELKKVMNSMYGKKESRLTESSVDNPYMDKGYRYRIEIKCDGITKEEIEEIIEKHPNVWYKRIALDRKFRE